jgi:hypothetical protein
VCVGQEQFIEAHYLHFVGNLHGHDVALRYTGNAQDRTWFNRKYVRSYQKFVHVELHNNLNPLGLRSRGVRLRFCCQYFLIMPSVVGGNPGVLYPTSKGAIIQLTRAMAAHHGPENIRRVI